MNAEPVHLALLDVVVECRCRPLQRVEWVDELIAIRGGADLLIAEAYTYERKTSLHLDLATLEAKLPQVAPKRLILTPMSDDMLARARSLPYETAGDRKRVVIRGSRCGCRSTRWGIVRTGRLSPRVLSRGRCGTMASRRCDQRTVLGHCVMTGGKVRSLLT